MPARMSTGSGRKVAKKKKNAAVPGNEVVATIETIVQESANEEDAGDAGDLNRGLTFASDFEDEVDGDLVTSQAKAVEMVEKMNEDNEMWIKQKKEMEQKAEAAMKRARTSGDPAAEKKSQMAGRCSI